jgi:hypothetical protein
MKRWKILGMLLILSILSLLVLWLFFADAPKDTLKFEFAKVLLQIGVVSFIGFLTSILLFEYQRDRMNLEYREELLKSTLTKILAAYSSVKTARRLIRAIAIYTGSGYRILVAGKLLDRYMLLVNKAQLDIENLIRDVETSSPAFGKIVSLSINLKSIDSYLGNLISEYEEFRPQFLIEENEPIIELFRLNNFTDFIGPAAAPGSIFKKKIIEPIHNLQKELRADLLHPKLT